MTVITNQFDISTTSNTKEDILEGIFNADNRDTPVLNMLKSSTANNILHSWETENLAAPAYTTVPFGDQVNATPQTTTARVSNHVGEVRRDVAISDAAQMVDAYGIKDRLAHEVMNKTIEIKVAIEKGILGNNVPTAGTNSTAGIMRGLPGWVSNGSGGGRVKAGTGGADGSVSAARTDGTLRTFTETMLETVVDTLVEDHIQPDTILLNYSKMKKMNGFSGGLTQTREIEKDDGSRGSFIDIYVHPTGTKMDVIPSRHVRSRDVFVLPIDQVRIAYLGGKQVEVKELAKTGTNERRAIVSYPTLEVLTPESVGLITDLS